MTSSRSAQSVTVRVIGPKWSHDISIGTAPVYGTRPHVGFSPTMPHQDAGILIEPPWSPPIAPSTSPVATLIIIEKQDYRFDSTKRQNFRLTQICRRENKCLSNVLSLIGWLAYKRHKYFDTIKMWDQTEASTHACKGNYSHARSFLF